MNPLDKLLRKNLNAAQIAGFIISNLVGLAIVVSGLQIFSDVRPLWSGEDSFVKKGYIVVNKKISGGQTLGLASSAFSPAELDDIARQPWVRSVGRFTSADFRVSATIRSPRSDRGLSTFLFFESLPAGYVDTGGAPWSYTPGSPSVPIIMSRDYLALYNFGFAASAGLPQISEQLVSSVPLQINITSNSDPSRSIAMQGRIVGFSNRLNTILVPQEFMDWANAGYGSGAERLPSRIIIDVNSPGDVAISRYMDAHHYEIAGDKDSARANYLLNVATGVVLAVGAIISILSFFILFLSISLLMQKNREKLHSLIMLGYPLGAVGRPFRRVIIGVSLASLVLAVGVMLALRAYYLGAVEALGGGGSLLLSLTCVILLSALTILGNVLAVNRRVRSAFYK